VKPSTARRKGSQTEALLVSFLRANGYPHAERRHLNGSHDLGDVVGIPGVCLEVKSGARLDLSGWLAELEVEQEHADAHIGAVVVRPKGRPDPADWFAVITTSQLLDFLDIALRPTERTTP
jgi:hypothetical protein